MADKKKISLGGIDNAAEEKGSFMKALWQFIKFLVVSGLVTIIQLVLANVLPLIFDSVTATLPAFLQGIFAPNTIFDAATAKGVEQIGKYVVGGVIENGTVIGGVVTWGYLLPFFQFWHIYFKLLHIRSKNMFDSVTRRNILNFLF